MTKTNPPLNQETVSLSPNQEILQRNLSALKVRSPKAAALIEAALSSTEIEFSLAPTGDLIGIMDGRAMCSKRNPISEAITWANRYDPYQAGFYGILGFGIGHHLKALADHQNKLSVLLCFEPNIQLLRAVFERIDHSQWISQSLFLLATDPSDAPQISQLITGTEVFLTTGVEFAPHPPSTKRLAGQGTQFTSTLLDVVKSTRTHLVTGLAHSGFTLRNILMNAGTYASCSGIKPLEDSCKGKTAILIAAGPSLERNLHLLDDPTIRDRAVIIAVQTMLKPLLKRGIKPHFVTALDYHEISKRFYEGLTKEDVEGVRLIVEPKANAAIINSFPGEILCASEPQLDELLGVDLARDMGAIPAGATVAHLNYYLARYFGCSNIILIGQDLGFTDGQYYAAGASIHQIWAGELSEHRTLEMFEWERIARIKSLLRTKQDIHGREIYTDEQMSTYIAQFEIDFQQDSQRENYRIINATEGGVNIAHTEVMTLKDALSTCLDSQSINLPDTTTETHSDEQHQSKVCSRLQHVARQLQNIERNSKRTIELIKKAQDEIEDTARVDRHIKQMHTIRDQVLASHPGFDLVNFYNQRGGLNRFKVDREIRLHKDLTPTEKTSKQLDRDINNVQWIQESAKDVEKLIKRSISVIQGTATSLTRDEFADEDPSIESSQPITRNVDAIIFADPTTGPLGFERDLSLPVFQEMNALELTIKRLEQCTQLDNITIITSQPDQIKNLISNTTARVISVDPEPLQSRTKAIAAARAASSECWRGSISSLSCYDEGFDPQTLLSVMEQNNIDACAIVGSDWAMVDPQLVDRIVSRHKADPEHCRVPFSQAVPGIGCCILDHQAVESLTKAAQSASAHASIGAMLSYIPVGPQPDPISSPLCVNIETPIRDAGVRVVADSPLRRQAMAAVYQGLGESAWSTDSTKLVQAFKNELNKLQSTGPQQIELELTTNRNTQGPWAQMHECQTPSSQITLDQAETIYKQALELRQDCSILLAGRGDPLTRPDALSFTKLASDSGFTNIELRTDLANITHTPESIINSAITILSVDVLANTPPVYQQMTDMNESAGFESLLNTMQELFNARPKSALPTPWIVPRITRCDTAYPDIKGFYDRWLTVCGCATIDPNPNPNPQDRIQPLPVPTDRATQLHTQTLRIQCDGQVVDHQQNPIGSINAFELGIQKSYQAMLDHYANKTDSSVESKSITPSEVTA